METEGEPMKSGPTFLWSACVAIMISGCATEPPTYHRIESGGTGRNLEADIMSCDVYSQHLHPKGPTLQSPPDFRGIYPRSNIDQEITLWQNRRRAFDDCMEKKGWERD